MWDVEKYNMTLKRTVQHGEFLDVEVKTKEAVYNILAKKLYVSVDTVKSWGRKQSSGPRDQEDIKQLETIFGTCFCKKAKTMSMSDLIKVENYSDFTKKSIFKAYEIIMNHIKSNKIKDEDAYLEVCNKINNLKIAIPSDVYEKIIGFMKEYLDALICDEEGFFEYLYEKKVHAPDDSPIYVSDYYQYEWLRKEVSGLDFIVEDFEEFGMKELYPLLMS